MPFEVSFVQFNVINVRLCVTSYNLQYTIIKALNGLAVAHTFEL